MNKQSQKMIEECGQNITLEDDDDGKCGQNMILKDDDVQNMTDEKNGPQNLSLEEEKDFKITVEQNGKTIHDIYIQPKNLKYTKLFQTCVETGDTEVVLKLPQDTDLEAILYWEKFVKLIHDEPQIPKKPLNGNELTDISDDENIRQMLEIFDDKNIISSLTKVINLTNYIGCESLLHLCCARFAQLIRGKPLHKIKELLQQK